MCCGVVHHCSHIAHIHDDKLVTCYKDVSEHYRDCNGNSTSSAHVQGRRQLDLVLLLSGLCNTTLTYYCNPHAHAHYWYVQRLLPVSAHGEYISHRMKLLALLQFTPKTFETNELEHEVPCHREATQAYHSLRQWLPCSLHAVTCT